MGHLEGDFDGVFDEAAELAVLLVPGGLVDELFHLAAIGEGLFYGIGVQLLILKQPFELGLGRLGMAVHQVVADNLLSFAVDVGRVLVHVEDIALGVANGDGDILQVLEVIIHNRLF